MKQPFNQALIYDDNCPLCAAYTSAFVKTGFLDADKRISFSTINTADYDIDYNKARHEIPLVDLKSGKVKYGVDALAEILSQRFSFVKAGLKNRFINCFFRKLYRLISYNRKIIVAKPSTQKACFDCSPDYSFRHRFYLVFFTWCAANIMLVSAIGKSLQISIPAVHLWWLLAWMPTAVLLIVNKQKKEALDIMLHVGITMMIAAIIYAVILVFFNCYSHSIYFFMCWPPCRHAFGCNGK